jgi:hypothetical protein
MFICVPLRLTGMPENIRCQENVGLVNKEHTETDISAQLDECNELNINNNG